MKAKSKRVTANGLSATLPLCGLIALFAASLSAQWVRQDVDTTASFRGLAVVSEKIVWASGTGGTVIRTTDAGKSWQVMTVPGAEKLDFRDVEAFDASTAYILSIGNGDNSRIYKTTDGGKTWTLQFRNDNERAFFDAIGCWDRSNCIAMSDPVDGGFLLVSTSDGEKWQRVVSSKKPATVDGEAAFAASGTCLITQGSSNVFLVSGGKDANVFRSSDRGKTWSSIKAPIISGTSGSGIFSIAMRDAKNGVIVGGNYELPNENKSVLAITRDGGASWERATGLSGYRSGVAYVDDRTIVAVGTNGSDRSTDGGTTWKKLDDLNYNAVQARGRNAVWAVGPKGWVAVLK